MPYITTVWANRKYDPSEIELVTAWDEYCLDANPKGFEEERDKALASWGDDLLRHVTIEIYVPYEKIEQALNPPPIRLDAEVRNVGRAESP